MTTRLPVPCDSCKHALSESTCEAFPDRIPDSILLEGKPHNSPLPTQKNGIVWEFAPGTEREFQDWKSFQEGE